MWLAGWFRRSGWLADPAAVAGWLIPPGLRRSGWLAGWFRRSGWLAESAGSTKKTSRNETTLRLEISWEMPRSVAAVVITFQLFGLFGPCKELLGGKAYSISMHLPPPLEHSPTLQNSNNTKQYNTYIPQSKRQSTKHSSKKHTTINDTKANKQKQQYRTAYKQQQRQTTNSSKQSTLQFNNIPPATNTAKPLSAFSVIESKKKHVFTPLITFFPGIVWSGVSNWKAS